MAIQIKLKNSVVQDSTPSTSDLPAVGEIALNANINSIGGFMRASDNSIVKIFGPGSLSTPTATTTVSGISELATNSETTTGTATNRVVTPAGLNAVTVAERSTSNSTYLALAGGTLTGVVAATAGTNSAPAINFGDSDSGIFGGTNTVSLTAGGTTRLTADTGVSVVGTLAVTGAITSTSDLTIADKIIHSGDTNTAVRFPAADTVSVETGGSEALRVDSSGRLLVGTSSARVEGNGFASSFQIEGTSFADSSQIICRNQANNAGANLILQKSRGSTLGSQTILLNNDTVGSVVFEGSDGVNTDSIASILAAVDGTPGTNDMPGRLVFSTTADGAASPSERLRINSSGNVGIGTASNYDDSVLEVRKSSGGDGVAIRVTNDTTTNGSQAGIIFTNTTSDFTSAAIAHKRNDNALIFYNGQSAGGGGFANATERLRIDSSGRVHIGTTTNRLGETLHVLGQGIITSSAEDTNMMLFGSFGSSTALIGAFNNIPVVFRQNNTERMRIDTSGNVSVGGTSPSTQSAKFQTRGTSQNATRINMHHEGNSSASISANGGLVFGSDTANGTTQRMVLDTSGRLLLGVSSDSSTTSMTISGNSSNSAGQAQVHMDFGSTSVSSDTSLGIIRFRAGGDNRGADIRGVADGTWSVGSSHPTRLAFYTNPASSASTPTERMRITAAGKVGIGVTNPNHTLEVVGTFQANVAANTGSYTQAFNLTNAINADFNVHLKTNSTTIGPSTTTPLCFHTGGSGNERMRIDSSGRLLLGTTTARAVGGESNPVLHIEGSGNTSNSWINLTRFQAGTGSANFQFAKARSNTPGTYTVVQDGDNLGQISFLGADGTDMANYAAIMKVQVDGTPGSNDMPGRFVFMTTADGGTFPTERMRIDSDGDVLVGLTTALSTQAGSIQAAGPIIAKSYINAHTTNATVIEYLSNISRIRAYGATSGSGVLAFNVGGGGGATDSEAMRIHSNGRVAIGTTNGSAQFMVARDIADSASNSFDNQTVILTGTITGNNTNNRTGLYFAPFNSSNQYSPSAITCTAGANYASTLKFFVNAAGNGTGHLTAYERMRITSNGNVGIGTATIGNESDHRKLIISGAAGTGAGILEFQDTSNNTDGAIFADNGNLFIVADRDNTTGSSSIRFRVDGSSEKMRIDSSGNTFINCTSDPVSNNAKFAVQGGGDGLTVATFDFNSSASASNVTIKHGRAGAVSGTRVAKMIRFQNLSGTEVGTIESGISSTAYNTSSDYRLKENITNISDGITRIKQLIPKKFNFIGDGDKTLKDGFLAHEVSSVVPEAITGTKDEVDSDNNPVYQGIDQSKLVPLLVAAVQELIGKVEALEAA